MIRNLVRYGALAAVFGLGACEKQLVVENPNSPETERVIGTPADAEALLASYYKRWHDGLYRTGTSFHGMANVMSFQNYSSLANNCQNSRTPFTGYTNSNAPGNVCQGEQQRIYFVESEVNRVATSILKKLDLGPTVFTLGSPARDARGRAFAEFLNGAALGYLALFYDSAAIVSASTNPQDAGPLYGYAEVMDSSKAALQRAIDAANLTAAGADGFPLPASWIPSPTNFTVAEFIKMVRSHRARFAANVARTAAEAATFNWAAISADAAAGITSDHIINTDPTTGPFYTWYDTYDGSGGLWHQMSPFVIGMADGGASYGSWIAQPVGSRGAGNVSFTMVTPDLRFPQGADRTAQQADFAWESCEASGVPCKRYFRNRPSGSDQFAGAGWGSSNYDFVRFHQWAKGIGGTARKGPFPFFTLAENDLLRAEAEYRLGNFVTAATLTDKTRTAGMSGTPSVAKGGGLPSLVTDGVTNATATIPGGACVPKVPVAPFNIVACGTLWEAIKYEKRIETAYTNFATWYLEMRRWNDLSTNTPLFWAVPYQDLQARGYITTAIYGAGPGTGNAANSFAVGPTTYGW